MILLQLKSSSTMKSEGARPKMTPCPGAKLHPSAAPLIPISTVGEVGVLKLQQTAEPLYDIYGEVTNVRYPFSEKSVRYVDVRDAVFMLGKDFILA